MSKQKHNVVTRGMSGKVGLLVFRQRFGRTIIALAPEDAIIPSDKQLEVRSTFRQATRYAKAVLANLATRVAYLAMAKPGQSAFNLAIADFFKAPEIGEIDSSGYTGLAGSIIKAIAIDDFSVQSVTVRIETAAGTLIEEGNATMAADGLHWEFTASTNNATLAGSKLIFTATDLPGHSVTKQKTI